MSTPRFGGPEWVYGLKTVPQSTNAGHVIALTTSLSAIALICVVVRFATRWRILKVIGLDDISAAVSMLLGIGYTGIAVYQTRYGLGLSSDDFPLENAVPFSRIQYAGGPTYCLAILGFKVSILAHYLRLAGFNKTYRQVLMAAIALVTANQLIYTFLLSFACRPIAKQWDPALPGRCINQLATYFGSSLGLDVLIIALPFPILRRLQLNIRKKILLGCMFAIGFFLTAVQAIRVRTIAKLANYTDSMPIIEWSAVEINVGVIIACVPSFAPLVKFIGRKASSVHSRSKSRSKGTPKPSGEGFPVGPLNSPPLPASDKRWSTGPVKTSRHSTRFTENDDDEVELWTRRHEMDDDVHVWSDAGKRGTSSDNADSRKSDLEDGRATVSKTTGRRLSWAKPGGNNGIVVVRDIHIS